MTMYVTTVRNTNQETIIHFETVDDTGYEIDISSLAATTQVRNNDTPLVNIVRLICTGELGSKIVVSRDGKNIIVAAPENAPILDLTQYGISDSINNDKNVTIDQTVAGKGMTGYITLRKLAGWDTKVEYAEYGAYEDETRVGARTDVSGSPDNS